MSDYGHMSSLIRAKKRKMKEDPDVIDSGGSPECDLQDLDIERQNETTKDLDKNHPMEHSSGEYLSNSAESTEEQHEQKTHKGENANERDDEKELLRHVRKSRIKKMMG